MWENNSLRCFRSVTRKGFCHKDWEGCATVCKKKLKTKAQKFAGLNTFLLLLLRFVVLKKQILEVWTSLVTEPWATKSLSQSDKILSLRNIGGTLQTEINLQWFTREILCHNDLLEIVAWIRSFHSHFTSKDRMSD